MNEFFSWLVRSAFKGLCFSVGLLMVTAFIAVALPESALVENVGKMFALFVILNTLAVCAGGLGLTAIGVVTVGRIVLPIVASIAEATIYGIVSLLEAITSGIGRGFVVCRNAVSDYGFWYSAARVVFGIGVVAMMAIMVATGVWLDKADANAIGWMYARWLAVAVFVTANFTFVGPMVCGFVGDLLYVASRNRKATSLSA